MGSISWIQFPIMLWISFNQLLLHGVLFSPHPPAKSYLGKLFSRHQVFRSSVHSLASVNSLLFRGICICSVVNPWPQGLQTPALFTQMGFVRSLKMCLLFKSFSSSDLKLRSSTANIQGCITSWKHSQRC